MRKNKNLQKVTFERYFIQFPFAQLSSQNGTSCLKFCSYGYEFPDIKMGHDADWHKNYILLIVPGFRAEIDEVCFEGRSLSFFLERLKEFSALQRETVDFEPTEPYLGLYFSFNSMKKVIVKGYIQYPVGWGAKLDFKFETDLTYIDEFIKGIEEILKKFPVRY